MGKKKLTLESLFRNKADSVTIANKNLDWVKRALSKNPVGIDNKDGTTSSHVLAAETDSNGDWHVFPTLDYKDKKWKDMRVKEGIFPKEAFDNALDNNATINFGKDGDFAIEYSQNGLINHKQGDMKSKKKFGLGTRQYLETPAEAMAENDIAIAKAKYEAETDPWAIGLELMGGMAIDYGLSIAGGGGSGINKAALNSDIKADQDVAQGGNDEYGTSLYAAMGKTNAKGTIEAEGGEIVETPDGTVNKLLGAKHEQGGQDISIPDGTNIFSDRIFIKGKSIADRKEARTKKQTKLEKLLAKKPTDKLLKNSYEKSVSNFEKEEEKDLQVQDMIGFIAGSRGEAMFGIKSFGLPDIMDNLTMPDKAAFGFNGGDSPDTNSFGNLVGVAGNMISGFGPLFNTMKERATDTPNVNYYKDFGQDALDTIDTSKGYIAGQKDNALKDLKTSGAESKTQNRNTARGVNTMRALDLSTDQNVNKGRENIYDGFAKNMMSVLGQQANTELGIDAKVMGGEKEADIANRQDKAAYYSNLSKDISNVGTSLQQTGKDLNQQKQQDAINKILSQLSDYGITFDKQFNLKNPGE